MSEELSRYIACGEGISVEFKRCGGSPEKDVFETICSFANRQGGSILLGVLDDGTVEGIPQNSLTSVERNLANVTNNPKLFNVAPLIETSRLKDSNGKTVLRVWVPMGPSLYEFKGIAYDRCADVDIAVKSEPQKAAMIIRKQNYYTERNVLPWVTKDDLDLGLLDQARKLIEKSNAKHPWLSLDDDSLLQSARLFSRDPTTGQRGFNLASVALLGREETLLDVLPVYRTDVVVRRFDQDRYDDRLTCTKNLFLAFDEIIDFCTKWLPDSFALEGVQRVSIRNIIIRELVCNSLIHRELTSPRIASISIETDGIHVRNASRSVFTGPITLETLDPTPKNPIIANFFKQLGRAEELGSGTKAIYRLSNLYSGNPPHMEDGDVFTAFVPTPTPAGTKEKRTSKSTGNTSEMIEAVVSKLLEQMDSFPASAVSKEVTSVGERTVRRYLAAMVDSGYLATEGANKSVRYHRAGQ